ncbi:MAG TPA: MerR family transcriptional regulator, partial [Candidatus Acidoferrales bacterium]|nr:MerR family transcriptional regulator [Candidatus Acidoferrales bacterium]
MDSARPGNPSKFLSLKEAAQKLAVSVDVLLKWNEQNILKPVITPEGEVGYTEEQINHFLEIRGSGTAKTPLFETNTAKHTQPGRAESVFD